MTVHELRPAARSSRPLWRWRVTVIAAALAVAVPLVTTTPAHADSYPSWAEVQAAKTNAAAAQAEYTKIAGLITQLQQAAQAAASDELKKEFEYGQAKSALDTQTAKLNALTTQVNTAQKDATSAKTQYGKLASQLYISGGGNLTAKLLLSNGHADDLLDQLGTVSQLTDHISRLQAYAKQKQNVVSSLQEQAKSAETIRTSLEQDADAKYQAAQAAKVAADAALATQQKQSKVLYAQAASLKNTAASKEQQYYAGVERAQALAQQAASSGGSDGSIDTSAGCTGGCTPAAAQAYASSLLGSYGWSQDQMSCLVSLWDMESGWAWNAYNSSSGAYGIPQAWLASKLATAGPDWQTNGDTQVRWGLSYIASSYTTPCGAWNFEMSHDPHWY
ncbi:MAG TPA: hypothetical protein VG369_10335 [Humibacter sp.]|nr:hypothetical protein [Humibacter sp.]